MARAVRIDDITTPQAGFRTLEITHGVAPLPAARMRQGITQSVEAWLDEATFFEDVTGEELTKILIRLGLNMWRRANPAMNNPSLLIGKTITLTITTTSITVAVS